MKTNIVIAVALFALVIGAGIYALDGGGRAGVEIAPYVVVSNSSSTVTSTATLALTAFNGAQFRSFTNLGNGVVYLSFKSTSTGFVAQTGYALTPSSTLEMSEAQGNLWQGNVYAISDTGFTPKLSISQF